MAYTLVTLRIKYAEYEERSVNSVRLTHIPRKNEYVWFDGMSFSVERVYYLAAPKTVMSHRPGPELPVAVVDVKETRHQGSVEAADLLQAEVPTPPPAPAVQTPGPIPPWDRDGQIDRLQELVEGQRKRIDDLIRNNLTAAEEREKALAHVDQLRKNLKLALKRHKQLVEERSAIPQEPAPAPDPLPPREVLARKLREYKELSEGQRRRIGDLIRRNLELSEDRDDVMRQLRALQKEHQALRGELMGLLGVTEDQTDDGGDL